MKKNVVILGGGLAGLAAADELLNKNYNVLILEKAPFLGGLASSFVMENEQIPRFNHHIINSNKITIEYLNRYNLMGNNTWKKIKMAMGVDSKIHGVNSPLELLKFSYLSFWGRIKMGLFGAYLIFLMNPEKIRDNLDAESWLLKYAGKENTIKIWHHLYAKNKFNINLNEISAKQFAHRLYEKEGYDSFTFPTKGIQGMIDGLEKDIIKKGGKILTKTDIIELEVKKKKIKYSNNYKTIEEEYDILINTIPVPELLKFTKNLPSHYTENIKKLRYTPVVGLCFGTKEFLNKRYYWINLFNERIHVVYQHSLIIDKYKSKVSWCVRYGGSEEDFKLSDEEIKQIYLKTLKKYFPDMQVNWCFVFREKYAEPIYDRDYLNYAPSYKTPVEGFYNSGIQVTFPKIRNMNVALESGIKAAEIIEKDFSWFS
ncbi:FAD-dependent oxidoreductase [Candidatus Woesearchaeota archaeon]|nr:FAD-dependent oxidoreductase [Candidatus Woesearchaeota archaeon]